MKPTFHSTLVSRSCLALFLLVLIGTATDCIARSGRRQQDDELSRKTSAGLSKSEGAQNPSQQQNVSSPASADRHEFTVESAYDYDGGDPGSRLDNGLPPTTPPTTITKVYERVVLEGSKISISCPHYTPTIAPAETSFAKIQRNSDLNEHKQPKPLRRYKLNSEEAAAAGIAALDDDDDIEGTTALNSNAELRVKWFRNHVPLQDPSHSHHRRAQHGSSFPSSAYDESETSASLFEATTTSATTVGTKITELNRTTELSQTVPANLSDKQQWQAAQRNLLKTSGPEFGMGGERTVVSLTSESVNEPAADGRKHTNMLELQRGHSRQQSQQRQQRWQNQQRWYVNKFGELVINGVSRSFAGKYSCLAEGKQSEVLLDVLLDSQAADKSLEQAYRIEEEPQQEETVMSVFDGRDVSSSKVFVSELSVLASTRPKITAFHAAEGGNNNNAPVLSLSNENSFGNEEAHEITGSRPTVYKEKDNSESRAREDNSKPSLTPLSEVTSLAEQLPEPTFSTTASDWQGGIQETRGRSSVDKNSSEIGVNSIKTLADGVILDTGSSERQRFLLSSAALPPPPSLENNHLLEGGGNNYEAAEGKVQATLSLPSASKATEIISDLRSYMFPRKHLAQTPTVHLVKSEVILMSDLESVPGFLYTKQKLHCPIAFSQRKIKREYILPLILALCPKAHSQTGHTNANLAGSNKHELQRRELQCYHLAEHVISQLTRNCSTSVLDLVWFKDGKLLEFDAKGIGRDRELNVKVIDSLEQFNTTASESVTNSSTARFGKSTSGQSSIESSVSLSSSSQFADFQRPGWTCPIFSGRTLEIDGVRRDSAGRYTCAFRLSIAKLEEIILRQTASTNARNSSIKLKPGALLSSVTWSQPPAHDNDISCCDEHGRAPIHSSFHSAAKRNSRSKNARHPRHHQQQKQKQSLQPIEAQIETNVSKTIASNSNGEGSTVASSYTSREHQEHQQRQINLSHDGARWLSKRIAILESILSWEPAREQSLNYIGQTLKRLQTPSEAAATTTIQTFSVLVTERAANSCDLWSTIAEAGNAYTRRKLADFKRLRRSVAVDRERQQMASRRSASRYSSSSAYNNKLKNVYRDKSSSMLVGRGRSETASMAIRVPDGSDVVAAAGGRSQERAAVASTEPQALEARPIKRLNVNMDGSVRQLSIDSSGGRPGGHWNANGEYSPDERRPIGRYRPRRPNQSTNDDNNGLEADDDASRSSGRSSSKSRRGGYDTSGGGKQNVSPIDERSKRNEQEQEKKEEEEEEAALNALHLMPDNNDSRETLVFTDYQQGYNLLLNNADELESDIETSQAAAGQTKRNGGARSNARGASSISSNEGGGGGSSSDNRDFANRGHYRPRRSLLHRRAAVSTGALGAEATASAPTLFNYANEASKKLGGHDERSTGSSNPIAPTATRAHALGASWPDEAASRRTGSGGSRTGTSGSRARALKGDRQRFNMMIEANHDYSLAKAETKDLITQRNSANRLIGETAESSASTNGDDLATRRLGNGQQPTFVGLASGDFQAHMNPMVIDDQQDKVARPIIDGNLVGERLAARRGYVAGATTNGDGDVGRGSAKAASGNAYFEQRDGRPVDDHDAADVKDFEADYQADAGIASSSDEEPSHRLRHNRQEAAELPDRGDETSRRAAARVDVASHSTESGSADSSGSSFGGPLTNLAGRERRKSRRATKSDVKSYVAAAGQTGTRLSWPTRAIDERPRDKRQDPLQGNKLLPLTIGDSDSGDQSSSWQGNEGSASSSGRALSSIANGPKSRSKDIEENDNQEDGGGRDGASQLNGPATQYSALGSQFLIDVRAQSTGEAASRKVSSTNQSVALPAREVGRSRNFVADQQITSAELAPESSPKRRGEKAVARLQAAPLSSSHSRSNDNSRIGNHRDDAEDDQDRDQNYGTGSISSTFASTDSNDQTPIFSDDRLDESLMWTAGQYLYMHMKALATSSIFGVEVDVEWSNERTNGSTNIDLSNDVDPTEFAATSSSTEWLANRQTRYAPPHLHDAAPFATVDVISGQSLTLQCTAQALGRLPEVKWYKRIHSIPLRLKSLVKMVRRIGHDLYWPLSELDLLKNDSSEPSFVCSQTSTIFDNLTNQTFTMVNSLQLSQYNDVIEQETVRSNSLTAGGDYNLYACIVDADVRHNYATLGVHLRQAPRKIPPEISKRLHARSAVLTKSPESNPNARLIRANKVTDYHQPAYTSYDFYRDARQLPFPMKDYWIPIQNEPHLKKTSIIESPLTPALLSTMIGFVFSSLLALLYLTFRSYRSLTNFQLDFDADESLGDSIDLSINPQCDLIVHPGSHVQEQERLEDKVDSQLICSCQLKANSNDDSHSLTTSAVMMIEDGSTLYDPENVIYTRFDQDISEASPHPSTMPPTFRYDTCSLPYRLCPYSNLHPQVPHEASDIWPQSHASFYGEQAPNLENH